MGLGRLGGGGEVPYRPYRPYHRQAWRTHPIWPLLAVALPLGVVALTVRMMITHTGRTQCRKNPQ